MPLYWVAFLPAVIYQLLAIAAALRHLRKRQKSALFSTFRPGVSVLKPLRGLDPNTYEAFVSQVQQNYPVFEILFGARDADDPAVAEVQRLRKQFPDKNIRLAIGSEPAANGKVGVLLEIARHARYPIWVINDSDIRVDPAYLSEIVAPLADSSIGVVTCLYRVKPHNLPAAWEALGIETDFMPSTLVAQLLGVREFGLGSTLAFRAADFERAGGFRAIADYLADDYQLAKHITGIGKRALLSTYTVETALGDASWQGVWNHQLRWARTIRFTKGTPYLGLPISHAGLWCVLAIATGAWIPAVALGVLRICSALITAGFVLQSPSRPLKSATGPPLPRGRGSVSCCKPMRRFLSRARKQAVLRAFQQPARQSAFCWLAPLWDLYAFCVWLTSYAGRGVRWRDRVLKVGPEGRIQFIE